MKFNSVSSLEKTYNLTKTIWAKCPLICEELKINFEQMIITFVADATDESIQSIIKLRSVGIIDCEIYYYDEISYVKILGSDVTELEQIVEQNSTPDAMDKILKKYNNRSNKEYNEHTPKFISVWHNMVPYKQWEKYWTIKGKQGPECLSDIPSYDEFYDTINN